MHQTARISRSQLITDSSPVSIFKYISFLQNTIDGNLKKSILIMIWGIYTFWRFKHTYIYIWVCLYIHITEFKYVFMYKSTNIHVYIHTFALLSQIQVECKIKILIKHCTIAYILLSVARTTQPWLESVPIHVNGHPLAEHWCIT